MDIKGFTFSKIKTNILPKNTEENSFAVVQKTLTLEKW